MTRDAPPPTVRLHLRDVGELEGVAESVNQLVDDGDIPAKHYLVCIKYKYLGEMWQMKWPHPGTNYRRRQDLIALLRMFCQNIDSHYEWGSGDVHTKGFDASEIFDNAAEQIKILDDSMKEEDGKFYMASHRVRAMVNGERDTVPDVSISVAVWKEARSVWRWFQYEVLLLLIPSILVTGCVVFVVMFVALTPTRRMIRFLHARWDRHTVSRGGARGRFLDDMGMLKNLVTMSEIDRGNQILNIYEAIDDYTSRIEHNRREMGAGWKREKAWRKIEEILMETAMPEEKREEAITIIEGAIQGAIDKAIREETMHDRELSEELQKKVRDQAPMDGNIVNVGEILGELQGGANMKFKGVEIEFHTPDDSVYVRGGNLYLILENLVQNACQAFVRDKNEENKVRISVRHSGADDFVFFVVEDNGPGFRAHQRGKNHIPEGGFGLKKAKEIIEIQGGNLDAFSRSVEYGGALVSFSLPRAD